MRKILSAVTALVLLLLLCVCPACAEEWDPMAWRRDCTISLAGLYFDDPHIGVPMPEKKGWRNKSRKEIPAGEYANAWQITGSGLSDGVPVKLEYTLYLRKDEDPADPETELKDWLAQYKGENGSYYLDGRPGAYSLHATEDGQEWEVCHRILFEKLILDVRVAWETPDRPAVGRDEILEPVGDITIRGWCGTLADHVEKLTVRCPGMVYPGQTLQCYATNAYREDVSDDVLWSAEGAEIDEHGFVTLYPDTKEGDSLTVTAALKDGSASVSKAIGVTRNELETIRWKLASPGVATQLQLPLPQAPDLTTYGPQLIPIYDSNAIAEYSLNSGAMLDSLQMAMDYRIEIWKELPKTRTEQVKLLKKWAGEAGGTPEFFSMNGWPGVYTVTEDVEGGRYACRSIHYRLIYDHRSSSRGRFDIDVRFSLDDTKALPEIDREHALALVSAIRVKDEPVVITDGDPVPVLLDAEEPRTITAGEKIQYTLAEGTPPDPSLGGIVWEVFGEDGNKVNGAKIKDGLLDAGKGIRKLTNLTVRARYRYCNDAAEAAVTVLPQLQKVAILSEGSFLYLGGDHTLTLAAAGDPEGSRLGALEWTFSGTENAEPAVNPDGTVVLRPLQAGTVKVTATDESGKKGTAVFTVAEPVTAVEILAKGKAAPGKTVSLTAKTMPEKPARKDVEWSVDVGENIAVINAKGQLKIAKTAPAGTVITVTCKALGAPDPVIAVLQVTVE